MTVGHLAGPVRGARRDEPTIGPAPLGLLAVGQSPREDVEATFRAVLLADLELRHAGALDGLDVEELHALTPTVGETPFETRLRGGSPILVGKERLLPLLVERVERELAGCSGVLLLCSGRFEGLHNRCPGVVEPASLVRAVVAAAAAGRVLGVIGPDSDLPDMPRTWSPVARELQTAAASAYGSQEEIVAAARTVVQQGADVVLLDCIGFTNEHQAAVAAAVQRPVICATTVIGRLLPELFLTVLAAQAGSGRGR